MTQNKSSGRKPAPQRPSRATTEPTAPAAPRARPSARLVSRSVEDEAPGGRRGRKPAERPHRDVGKKPARKSAAKPFATARPAKPRRERPAAKPAAPRPLEWTEVRYIKVDINSDGQRIDNFLMKHLPGVPKSAIYRLVRSGQVRVDGGRAKPERKLNITENVRIPPVRLQDPNEAVRPPDRVLNELRESVIYEDAHYLAINKPEGLSSHGGTGQLYGVIEAIRAWDKFEFIEL